MEKWQRYLEEYDEDDFLMDEKEQKKEKFDNYKSSGKKPLWRSDRVKAKQQKNNKCDNKTWD